MRGLVNVLSSQEIFGNKHFKTVSVIFKAARSSGAMVAASKVDRIHQFSSSLFIPLTWHETEGGRLSHSQLCCLA